MWLVEVLDKAINIGVLVAISKHVSLDSLAGNILPSCEYSYQSIKQLSSQMKSLYFYSNGKEKPLVVELNTLMKKDSHVLS